MKKLVLSVVLIILFYCCQTEKKEKFDMIITNGNVINIETGEITKQDILVNNGRIVKLESYTAKASTSKTIIDASNKFILPGFWDSCTF